MVFAAFGVDLASWYSRISYLQKAADAAALAGTVWMPDIGEATDGSLRAASSSNGIRRTAIGPGIEVDDRAGLDGDRPAGDRHRHRTPTGYFSQVFSTGQHGSHRYAEAEYNLPIPLGSPLNYFGGDRHQDRRAAPSRQLVGARGPPTTQPRAAPAQPGDCNVGTSAARASGGGRRDAADLQRQRLQRDHACAWTVVGHRRHGHVDASRRRTTSRRGADEPAPARRPRRTARQRRHQPSGGGPATRPPTSTTPPAALANGAPTCTWSNIGHDVVARSPSFADRPSPRPTGRAGSATRPHRRLVADGGAHSTASVPVGGQTHRALPGTAGPGQLRQPALPLDRRHREPPDHTPNPIPRRPQPGLLGRWSTGPATSPTGDAFSARCHGRRTTAAMQLQNLQYEPLPTTTAATGTSSKIGAAATARYDINVFDASYNRDRAPIAANAGDTRGDFGSDARASPRATGCTSRPTRSTSPTTPGTRSPAAGTRRRAAATGRWQPGRLPRPAGATSAPSPPGRTRTYLVNVRTTAPTRQRDGINGYASRPSRRGPPRGRPAGAVRLREHGMQNNNRCARRCAARHLLPGRGRPAVRRQDPGDRAVRRRRLPPAQRVLDP